jgi:hypothetical protein
MFGGSNTLLEPQLLWQQDLLGKCEYTGWDRSSITVSVQVVSGFYSFARPLVHE